MDEAERCNVTDCVGQLVMEPGQCCPVCSKSSPYFYLPSKYQGDFSEGCIYIKCFFLNAVIIAVVFHVLISYAIYLKLEHVIPSGYSTVGSIGTIYMLFYLGQSPYELACPPNNSDRWTR